MSKSRLFFTSGVEGKSVNKKEKQFAGKTAFKSRIMKLFFRR